MGDKGWLAHMAKQRMCTMREVAKFANVSISTVSAVINNKGIISPKLTARVLRAVRVLGYSPHQEARGLRVGRNHLIGMVIADVANPFYVGILRAFEHAAKDSGYDVMICDSDDQIDIEHSHLGALHARRVEGIVLAPVDSYAARAVALRSPVPMVFVDSVPLNAKVNCVVTNNSEASYEAINYLLRLGHRRIAVVSTRPFQSTTVERLEGCQRAMQEAGLPAREEYIPADMPEIEGAYLCVLRFLGNSPEPPTAIFSINNRVSVGALQALRELAIPCPERVSVLGFDDPAWAVISKPALTSVRQPADEIGKCAVELLLRMIESAEEEVAKEPEQIVLKSSLHIRESTGIPCEARAHVEATASSSIPGSRASGETPG